jgi:hypothetical protein
MIPILVIPILGDELKESDKWHFQQQQKKSAAKNATLRHFAKCPTGTLHFQSLNPSPLPAWTDGFEGSSFGIIIFIKRKDYCSIIISLVKRQKRASILKQIHWSKSHRWRSFQTRRQRVKCCAPRRSESWIPTLFFSLRRRPSVVLMLLRKSTHW